MREPGGVRVGVHQLVEWVVEQWFHGHHDEPVGEVRVVDVVVPRPWTEWVVGEAERFCREAVTEVAV